MKKQILIALIMLSGLAMQAQDRKPPTMEERMKRTMDMLQKEVQPTEQQVKALEPVFTKFFTEQEKLRKDAPPPPPDPKMREAMQKLMKERDTAIKGILSEDQYKKYETAIANMRRGGPGGPGGPPRQ
jgi:hypothetical protein